MANLRRKHPEDVDLIMEEAAIHWRLRRLDAAIDSYRKVLRKEPRHATAALSLEATAAALFHAVHAHPTLAEAMGEAALAIHGRAIHF